MERIRGPSIAQPNGQRFVTASTAMKKLPTFLNARGRQRERRWNDEPSRDSAGCQVNIVGFSQTGGSHQPPR